MKKKLAHQTSLFKNKFLSAFILCGLILQTLCLYETRAEGVAPEVSPIDLSPSEEADLSSADTISMSFDGALLKDVLLLFSQQSGLNFVASQETETKKVTVYFENVSPKDALDSIITANGLTYSKKPGSDIYVVAPANKSQTAVLVTKIVRLKFMRLSNSPLDVGAQVTIRNLAQSAGSTSSSGSSASSGGSAGSGSDNGADKIVQKLLTPSGKVTTDLHTNSLIITDTKESVEAIERILLELDTPSAQVLLEVYIMEVSKTVAQNIGVDWGGSDGALGTISGGLSTTTFPFNQSILRDEKGIRTGEITDGAITETNAVANRQTQFGLVNANNFQATLHYIESDSKTKILARPKVLTQNNEAAEIKLVANAAIGVSANTSGEGAAANTTEEAERSDIGITMRITPQINSDDTVLLFLEPSVSTAQASRFFPDTFVDPTTRLIRTMARIKDNQTLVIGGLVDSQTENQVKKMPFLGDIPIIGKAFKYQSKDDTERELLIFVTPHIARGSTSLGSRSATAQGEDLSLKHLLSEFMDNEMDKLTDNFSDEQAKQDNFFTKDQEFIRASERKSANPAVEQQMTHALDSLSPQIVDQKINQAMDSLSAKKRG